MSVDRPPAVTENNGAATPADGAETALGRNRPDGYAPPPVQRPVNVLHQRGERLLRYLPSIYSEDDFTARFLGIFEGMLDPIEQLVRDLPYYFDPATAPPALLPWLAEWLATDDAAAWPAPAQRALLRDAVRIFGRRGTAEGLQLHLAALIGTPPLLTDNGTGFRLGTTARLGYNTVLGTEQPNTFTVTLVVADPATLDTDLVREAIERETPVGAQYVLRVVAK
jgi:phage tail-like protein